MELALITAQQVAVLFLLIGTGMVAVKTGVLKLENKQALSNLLVYIIVPAMVVNSYRMEFSTQILHNLLAAFGMSHCIDYLSSFSFSIFSISILMLFSLAVLLTHRFSASMATDTLSSLWLINAKSLISSSVIFPSRAIWIRRPVSGLISSRLAIVSKMMLESSDISISGT